MTRRVGCCRSRRAGRRRSSSDFTLGLAKPDPWDGTRLIAEYSGSGQLLRRYAHGAGVDEPLAWYEGSGAGDRRLLYADERGSIIGVEQGGSLFINRYDEYGQPGPTHTGRFGYTGQAWLPELQLWHYKARAYAPRIGRFMQTDPIGTEDQINLYAYVGNDPLNKTDPDGQFVVPLGRFLFGFGMSVGEQMLLGGKDLGDIDLAEAGITGLQSMLGFGAIDQVSKVEKALKNVRSAEKNLKKAEKYTRNKMKEGSNRKVRDAVRREENARQKTAESVEEAVKKAATGVAGVVAAEQAKEHVPEVTPKDIKREVEGVLPPRCVPKEACM